MVMGVGGPGVLDGGGGRGGDGSISGLVSVPADVEGGGWLVPLSSSGLPVEVVVEREMRAGNGDGVVSPLNDCRACSGCCNIPDACGMAGMNSGSRGRD